MTIKTKTASVDTFHNFDYRDKKLHVFKEKYYELSDTEARARYIKLTGETRNKAGLGIIYGNQEKELLKFFLKDVVAIALAQSGWNETPDTVFHKTIEKHTNKDFNPRNFLSNGYNNSENGEASTYGGFLFFGEHNIKNAQAFLDYLNKN